MAVVALALGGIATGAQATTVSRLDIAFERTTASKCPVTFDIHGYFRGLPEGAQTIEYRLVGAQEWKTLTVPAERDLVHHAVLETVSWEWTPDSSDYSVQIEVNQAGGLRSNTLYYFKCGGPPSGETFGVAAEDITRTASGGPMAELAADAQLASVRARSGAQAALVNRYDVKADLAAGPISYEQVWSAQPAGLAINVQTMTGAQLKKLLATPNQAGWVLTPSAGLRYTLAGGNVVSMTLNGVPVADTQQIKVAGGWSLIAGFDGWPRWEGTTTYLSGPDDTGALATYLVAHSPVRAPAGDRVTVR
ncbi:5'-nucleotidase, C-terminal domain [Nonomuraea solani]|uniref:5'-nucleotidase, C-terminal domain n=1 Tax=Nonomuraea solani TaxID=1144553 RepID=A0A1H6ET36_9ACTN|nr:5'-nucleotidase [Nonomuraea solani]SEH01020.1 5'-nucleotidase, C-terminal domain [Nonomuraea solani]